MALSLFTALSVVIDTDSVLPIIGPLADVLVTVRKDHGSIAVLLSLHEVTVVALAVLVRQLSFAFEEILAEGTFVCSLRLSEIIYT